MRRPGPLESPAPRASPADRCICSMRCERVGAAPALCALLVRTLPPPRPVPHARQAALRSSLAPFAPPASAACRCPTLTAACGGSGKELHSAAPRAPPGAAAQGEAGCGGSKRRTRWQAGMAPSAG